MKVMVSNELRLFIDEKVIFGEKKNNGVGLQSGTKIFINHIEPRRIPRQKSKL
jgi:hypothetical protein